MAQSKSRPGTDKALTLKTTEVVVQHEPAELILSEFRIVKCVSERFRAPEDARIGTYKLAAEANQADFPEDLTVLRSGKATYSMTLAGSTKDEDHTVIKSFSIHIESEGKFDIHGDFDPNDEAKYPLLLAPVLSIMHALCIHHARVEADSMGYRSVRPSYQVRNRPMPILEPVEDKP